MRFLKRQEIFNQEFERSESFADLFELIKSIVRNSIGRERSGLMLAFEELGVRPNGFVGGFHPVGSNFIVMNKSAARMIKETLPQMYKAYCFHILLHEYLHTLGFLDELNTRVVAHLVTKEAFGENHPATYMSSKFHEMLNQMPVGLYSIAQKQERGGIEIVDDFDSASTNYIG